MPALGSLVELSASGLYCAAGDFFIDPWRPVARAVITHAHADHARPGSERYFAERRGVGLLERRLGSPPIAGLDYGESVRFDQVEVSLHPAGHVLGSSQVRIAGHGEVWVVSGDFKRQPDPTCAAFEPLACDVFITEATFALPVYRWPETAAVAREVVDWWQGNAARGTPSVLFCYALGKAQRLLAELRDLPSLPVYTHGAVEAINDVYRAAGVTLPVTERVDDADQDYTRALILAPPGAAGSTWMRRFGAASTGFCSGWMLLRGNRRRRGYDRGFVLSDHADWPGLIDSIQATGARRVFTTHGQSDLLARYLRERGVEAAPVATEFDGEGGSDAAL
ncbi:MAG: ligase-associated DNA damage response exonuclease [Pseudomonadales bacterium]